jgi:hypothetical protein
MSIVLDGSNVNTVGVPNLGTAQASTSGTAISFTGIPSGVKRITVMLNAVKGSGTSNFQIQIGSGSYVTTGYTGGIGQAGGTGSNVVFSTGLGVTASNANSLSTSGIVTFALLGSNVWTGSSTTGRSDGYGQIGGTTVTLSGTLDRIQLTTVNGTDTFTAGSINIQYE